MNMKLRNVLVGCMVMVAVVMTLCHAEQACAKTNTFYRTITVQKGKSYGLNDFLKKIGGNEVRAKIKKGKKVMLSGKGLTIKKRNFKAKKIGKYKLNIKIKNEKFVFPLSVIDKTLQIKPNKIAKITISTKVMGQTTSAEVKDRETINQIANKINQAKFSFDFAKSMRPRVGFAGHYVSFYAGDGTLLKEVAMAGNEVREDKWTCWKAASDECYNYVKSVYNSILSGNTQLSQ